MRMTSLVAGVVLLIGAASCKKGNEEDGAGMKGEPAATTDVDRGGAGTAEPVAPAEPGKEKLDTPEDKVAFQKSCFEYMNTKQWEKLGLCWVEDAVSDQVDSGSPPTNGRAAIVDTMKNMDKGFPDFRADAPYILINGEKMAMMVVVTGTNSQPLQAVDGELPATNKKIGLQLLETWEFDRARGGVVQEKVFWDSDTLLAQIGVVEQPHRAAAPKPGDSQVIVARNDAAEKANVELYAKSVEAWNNKDLKAIDAMVDDKAVFHDLSLAEDIDKKASAAHMAELQRAFPDAKCEVLEVWAAGDFVVAITKDSGTHKGPLPSLNMKKATRNPVEFTSARVLRFQASKVIEGWHFRNGSAVVAQLLAKKKRKA